MIPAGFVFLDRMPLTAHGKVDRPALAAIRQDLKVAGSEFVAPRDTTEEVLARHLGGPTRGRENRRLRQFLRLGRSFATGGAGACPGRRMPSECRCRSGPFSKRRRSRLWPGGSDEARETQSTSRRSRSRAAKEMAPSRCPFVQEHMLRIERELARTAPVQPTLRLSAAGAAERPRAPAEPGRGRAPARLACAWDLPGPTSVPVALIAPAFEFDSCSRRARPCTLDAYRKRSARRRFCSRRRSCEAEQEAWTPIDVSRAPLFRMRLLRLGADDHVLLLILHHIIVDGWSIGDPDGGSLGTLLQPLTAGRPSAAARSGASVLRLRSLAASVVHQRGQRVQQFAYWKRHLRDASPVFPTTGDLRKRPAVLATLRTNQFVCRRIWSRACAR